MTSRGSPDPRAGNTDPSGRAAGVMAQRQHGGLCTKATPLGQSPAGGRVGRAGRRQTARQDCEGRPPWDRPMQGADVCTATLFKVPLVPGRLSSVPRPRQAGWRPTQRGVLGQMTRRGEVSGATLRLHVRASPAESGHRACGWKKAAPGAMEAMAGRRSGRGGRHGSNALPCPPLLLSGTPASVRTIRQLFV